MSFIGAGDYLRYLSLGVIMCGVVVTPIVITSLGGAVPTNSMSPKLPVEKVSVVGAEVDNREKLGIQTDKLFENVKTNEEKTYNFDEVTLNLGSYRLQKNDALVSPEQNGIYYLARFRGNRGFELDDGTIVMTFRSASFKNKNYKNIRLGWRTHAGSFISRVTLGSCKFEATNKQDIGKQLTITCSQFQGEASSRGESATVTINEDEFRKFIS